MTFTWDSGDTFDAGSSFDDFEPVPVPNPTLPVAAVHTIQYWFTDLYSTPIAVLPLTGVSFSRQLNGVGTFSGTLPVEDPNVRNSDWIAATEVNKTLLWVVLDGSSVVWGGWVQQAAYDEGAGTVQVTANEFTQYIGQLLQAKDYSTGWATATPVTTPPVPTSGAFTPNDTGYDVFVVIDWGESKPGLVEVQDGFPATQVGGAYVVPAGNAIAVGYFDAPLGGWTWTAGEASAMGMAYTMIADALATANAVPLFVAEEGVVPVAYYLNASFPISQQQQLSSLIQQMQEMGYLVGFDYASDSYIINGTFVGGITLSYPRRGRLAGTTGLTVTAPFVSMKFNVDGTQQAVHVQEMASSGGGVGASSTWDPAMVVDGYPFTQAVESHMMFSPSSYSTASEDTPDQVVLDAWGADDLALYAYPTVTFTIEVPLFGATLAIGDFDLGDDMRIIIPPASGGPGVPSSPRFPDGLDYYMRIVEVKVKVPDAGAPTMTFTLNMPPSSTPQRPPG